MATKSKARTKKKRECPDGYHKVYPEAGEKAVNKETGKRNFKCVKTEEHGKGVKEPEEDRRPDGPDFEKIRRQTQNKTDKEG